MNEGYPCIWWYDYFNLELARPGTPNGIDALIDAHHKYAAGEACILHADPDLYVMQRSGIDHQPGCVYVLNNLGDKWSGTSVKTTWPNQKFKRVGWARHCAPG
jgi:alpha-amylase